MNEAMKSGKKEKEDDVERAKRLRDKYAAIAQRKLARRKMTERKKELAREILAGRLTLAEERERDNLASFRQKIDANLTRNIDRVLFDLPLLPEETKENVKKGKVKEIEKVE